MTAKTGAWGQRARSWSSKGGLLTKETEKVLSTVDRAQLHVLVAKLLELLRILAALKAVKEVVPQRLVEVETESSGHLGGETVSRRAVSANEKRKEGRMEAHRRRSWSSF